jgi:mRNA-degrading endonuclease RelE of RelBE toxin-antitoxin system
VSHGPYELVLTPPAIQAVRSGLPEGVAAAVIKFLTGALVENPQRVGKQLRGDLAGIHSTRRGTYVSCIESTRSSAKSWSCASNTDETLTDPDDLLPMTGPRPSVRLADCVPGRNRNDDRQIRNRP